MAAANECLPIDWLDHVAYVDDLDLMNNTAFSYSLQREQMIFRWSQLCSSLGGMNGQDEDKVIIKKCLVGTTWSKVYKLFTVVEQWHNLTH